MQETWIRQLDRAGRGLGMILSLALLATLFVLLDAPLRGHRPSSCSIGAALLNLAAIARACIAIYRVTGVQCALENEVQQHAANARVRRSGIRPIDEEEHR